MSFNPSPMRILIVSPYPELIIDCAFMMRSYLNCEVYECHDIDDFSKQLQLTAGYNMFVFLKAPEIYKFFNKMYASYEKSYVLNFDSTQGYHATVEDFLSKLKDQFVQQDFTPVHHNLVLFHGFIPIDLYMKLSDDNIVKFINAHSTIKKTDIKHLIELGFEYFYVRSSDIKSFQSYSSKNIETYLLELSIQDNSVLELLKTFKIQVREQFPKINSKIYLEYDINFISALKLCFVHPTLKKKINEKLTAHPYFPLHMYVVGLICTRLAYLSGSEAKILNSLFAFSSIVHDLGLSMDEEEEMSSILRLETGELDLLPEKSVDLIHHGEKVLSWLIEIPCLPDWISDLLLKHHERPKGQGFPIGEDTRHAAFQTATFIVAHMLFDHLYVNRNSRTSGADQLKNFPMKELQIGATKEIAYNVLKLDIF